MLSGYLKDDLILEFSGCKTWKESLHEISRALFQRGYVTSGYENAILQRESDYPTGLDFEDGLPIALPHADSSHVKETGIGLAVFPTKSVFRRMDDPQKEVKVTMAVIIAMKEGTHQVDLLQELMELFQNRQLRQHIVDADSRLEIVRILHNAIV